MALEDAIIELYKGSKCTKLVATILFMNLCIVHGVSNKFANELFTLLHLHCRNPTLAKCEDETRTHKIGDLESSGTLECLEFDSKAQNTSHWSVLGVIGKVLKCKCPKWPRIDHLDICNPSYEQKKGRESN